MIFKFKSINFFLFLVLFLGVPYAVKLIDNRLELFPAIIFPSSSQKRILGDEVDIWVTELYGKTANGQEKNLDKSTFLKVITPDYLELLLKEELGLNPSRSRSFNTIRFGIPIKLESKITSQDILETKSWLRQRMREQGCLDEILIIKKKQVIVLRDGTYKQDTQIVNDTVYNLY